MINMRKSIGHIPLLIVSIMMAYCLYVVMTTNIALQWKHYVGIIIILISIIALIFNYTVASKWAVLIGLIGSTFNFVAFTAIIDYVTFGGSIEGKGLDVNFQPYSLLILILFIFLNLDFIKAIFNRKSQV